MGIEKLKNDLLNNYYKNVIIFILCNYYFCSLEFLKIITVIFYLVEYPTNNFTHNRN